MKILIDIPEEEYKHLAYADHFKLRSYIESGKIVDKDESKQEPCGDAISRQAAIDACLNGWNKDYKEIVEEIRALPPVTPQYTDTEIQKMQDLEFAEIQKAYEIGKEKGSDVLDKIRAELHATAEMHEDGNYYLREEWIDEIFDKYKAESEDKVWR